MDPLSGPLHKLTKDCDHVLVTAFDSHSKGHATDMVCHNLCHVYLLEVGLMQILAYHETTHTACHVGTHVDFSSVIISLVP